MPSLNFQLPQSENALLCFIFAFDKNIGQTRIEEKMS